MAHSAELPELSLQQQSDEASGNTIAEISKSIGI